MAGDAVKASIARRRGSNNSPGFLSAGVAIGRLGFMNVVAHGIDLIECERIASILEKHPDRFLERILTPGERKRAAQFKEPVPHITGRFAAKEAVLKVLGTGWRGEISWHDIEITNDPLGRPVVQLSGECARIAGAKGIGKILLSITHTANYASASTIGLGRA